MQYFATLCYQYYFLIKMVCDIADLLISNAIKGHNEDVNRINDPLSLKAFFTD